MWRGRSSHQQPPSATQMTKEHEADSQKLPEKKAAAKETQL